jgi:hypothetical protein
MSLYLSNICLTGSNICLQIQYLYMSTYKSNICVLHVVQYLVTHPIFVYKSNICLLVQYLFTSPILVYESNICLLFQYLFKSPIFVFKSKICIQVLTSTRFAHKPHICLLVLMSLIFVCLTGSNIYLLVQYLFTSPIFVYESKICIQVLFAFVYKYKMCIF